MKDSVRRLVIFVTIVGLGSAMILVNIPLIYMLLLIVAVGLLLLILLGAITVAEIKEATSTLSITSKRKKPALQKPESRQITEKTPAAQKNTGGKKVEKKLPVKTVEKSGGIRAHLSLLASSVESLGKILTERRKPRKKVEEIDKLLDHTISERVSRSSALESAGTVPAAIGSRGGAGGALPGGSGKEIDPFLSLSGEELETGLLDGLDEPELSAPSPDTHGVQQVDDSGISLPDVEMPPLPEETTDEASAILAANAEDIADETEGGDGLGENLGDLDSINLDEIDLGDDNSVMETPAAAPQPAAGPAPGSSSLIPATPITPAGAPEFGMEDQSDISSFASGTTPTSDDDMLSSLASDIKQIKKEKDVSLLRELKDFKAPATDIEKELSDISEQFNIASKGAEKKNPSVQGIK